MSRTRSIRCTENTNVIKILNRFNDANRGTHQNPCTFKGIIINVLNAGSNGQGAFKIYDNNIGSGFTVPAAVANLTSNVITVDEDLTTDASDAGLVIDSAGGDNDGLIAQFTINFGAGGNTGLTLVHEIDGIMCHNGLRIESASWTNLEVFVLVG